MSELSKARIPDAPAIQRLPLLQLILVGLQHVLLMYGGAIAVPLIIGFVETVSSIVSFSCSGIVFDVASFAISFIGSGVLLSKIIYVATATLAAIDAPMITFVNTETPTAAGATAPNCEVIPDQSSGRTEDSMPESLSLNNSFM